MPALRKHVLGPSALQGLGCGRCSNMPAELYGTELGPRAALGGNQTGLELNWFEGKTEQLLSALYLSEGRAF